MHFSASLALTTTLPGNQNPFVGNLRTELAALQTGLLKELDDHYRGEAAKAELRRIIQDIDQQYLLLNNLMRLNDIGAGDSLGDLLADQIGVMVGISLNALRQLKFNDNYNPN